MLNLRRSYLPNRGFTVIELILVMAISSMLVLPFISILNLSNISCASTEEKDELMLNANFAIDYIKYEIKSADKIISSQKFKELDAKYPTNIGFVIKINDLQEGKSRYITYYTDKDNLIRIACEKENENYPEMKDFKGFNEICEFVESIERNTLNGDNPTIDLDFKFNNKCDLNVKSNVFIRCEIDD